MRGWRQPTDGSSLITLKKQTTTLIISSLLYPSSFKWARSKPDPNVPALLPTSFFSLMKRTKNQVSKNASLRTWPLRCKLDKTWAANNCAPASPARCLCFSKYLLCPATRKATIVLSNFARSCFADKRTSYNFVIAKQRPVGWECAVEDNRPTGAH